MPCYYTGTAEGDAKLAADEARRELTRVTSMLCELLARIDYEGEFTLTDLHDELVPGLNNFWQEHKAIDKKRKESIYEKAISKLTVEELRVLKELGLH